MIPLCLNASHFTGGEIYFDHLGGTTYLIRLDYYYDCTSSYSLPNSLPVHIRSNTCTDIVLPVNLEATYPKVVSTACPGIPTTCSGGTVYGIMHYRYSAAVNLGCNAADWIVSFEHCCRNPGITNLATINAPFYIETTLDNTSFQTNSSNRAALVPFFNICQNKMTNLNLGAIDPDGDSLSYHLIAPREDSITNVVYSGGYSPSSPFGTGQFISLNTFTGDISILCSTTEVIAIAIEIKEYRNGVYLGHTVREVQVGVITCGPNNNPLLSGINGSPYSNLSMDTTVVAGDTVSFNIYSSDPDPGSTLDMSWNPMTFPAPIFSISGNNTSNPIGTFTWVTSCSDASPSPHCFSVNLKDDFCPVNGLEKRTFCIYVNTAPDITFLNDSLVCSSDTNIQLIANYPGGQWTSQCMSPVDSLGLFDISNTSGPCTFYYEVNTNCVNHKDSGNIKVIELVLDSVNSSWNSCLDSCSGLIKIQAHASDGSGISYAWSNGQNVAQITNLCKGKYIVTINNSKGCSLIDTLDASMPNPLIIHTEQDQYFCEPSQTRTTIQVDSSNGGILYYVWNGDTSTSTNFFAFDSDTMLYAYVVDAYDCKSNIDSVAIYINQPTSNFKVQNEIMPTYNDPIHLINLNNDGIVYWSWTMIGEHGTEYIGSDSSIVLDLTSLGINRYSGLVQEKEIYLFVSDFAGCDHDTVIRIRYLDQDELFIPNAFTPDRDGLNDTYGPTSKYNMSEYSFTIFDRWGELIFRSSLIEDRWDGTYLGDKMAQGNYLWKLKYTLEHKDEPTERIGDVRLLRKR